MKKVIMLLVVSCMFVSCEQAVSKKDITTINGYWEIEKVVLVDGTNKEYKINESIDYFEIKESQHINKFVGFRQKVMPQFDGTYLTNGVKETVSISAENERFFINYTTELATWKEEIIEIKDSIFVLKNKEKLEYHYKRAKPFLIK